MIPGLSLLLSPLRVLLPNLTQWGFSTKGLNVKIKDIYSPPNPLFLVCRLCALTETEIGASLGTAEQQQTSPEACLSVQSPRRRFSRVLVAGWLALL